ncbi:MAG: SH3 domain-containing protein [Clostridia bacterium]|nr:SH3 domain-containing protein [Clostridia bacterium]
MTCEEFLQGIQQNVSRIREYRLGMDGNGGQCDCIGLIIGAVRLMGGKWTGTHGSNWTARNGMKALRKIASAGELQPGELVFKVCKPGEDGYSLPDTYRQHPDQKDYYHVGVVTAVNPLEITHCTGVPGGIRKDHALGTWQYAGMYIGLTDKESRNLYRVTGGRLKVRKGPGTSCAVIAHLPDGTPVKAAPVAGNDAWMQVEHEGVTGFSMARYLMPLHASGDALERLCTLLGEAVHLAQQLKSEA